MWKLLFATLLCATHMACVARHLPAAHTATSASYPEGPVITSDGLLFVEFSRDRVMRWRGSQAREVWRSPGCGPAGLAALADGTVWIACHTRHQLSHVRLSHPPQTLQTYDVPYPNDIAIDHHGGVYVTASGIFDPDAPVGGEVYYIDAQGDMSRAAQDIHYSNGIALSQDGTQLSVSEHLRNRVRTYRVGEPGDLAHDFTATHLTAYAAHPQSANDALLGPDGLGIDAKGYLWVAHYAGGRLLRLASDGRTAGSVSFAPPFVNVTNVTSHPDGRLFVTLVSDDAAADHPGAVAALAPSAWKRDHMHCTVVPPHVSCVPAPNPQQP